MISRETIELLLQEGFKNCVSQGKQLPEIGCHEVLSESEIDGVRYYLVRHQPKVSQEVRLSPRELAIAQLVAQGLPNKCIGHQLGITHWTVATYLRRIFNKLGVSSRTTMIVRLLAENLLEDVSK